MGNVVTYIFAGIGAGLLLLATFFIFIECFYGGYGQDTLFAASFMLIFAIGLYVGGIFLSLKANFSDQVGKVAGGAVQVVAANPQLLLAA